MEIERRGFIPGIVFCLFTCRWAYKGEGGGVGVAYNQDFTVVYKKLATD